MTSLHILALALILGANAAGIYGILSLFARGQREEPDAEQQMTEYVYSDGQWVRI